MKITADCYSITANGEHGRFYLRTGAETMADGKLRHWCELTCNTTFGVVGHYWSHMGCPADEFLSHCDAGYLGSKLWGADAQVFDADTAIENTKALIQRALDDEQIEDDEAAELRDALDGGLSNECEWYACVVLHERLHNLVLDNCGVDYKADNRQMVGFFERLWPAFIAELTKERA